MRDSPFNRRMETVADIAFMAGGYRHHSGDSRQDVANYMQWAEEFEANRVVDPAGNESYFGKDYMTAIEQFALTRLEAEGVPKKAKSIQVALASFLEVWGNDTMLYDIGPKLTCTECNALEELLRQSGFNEEADNLVDGHAWEDEEGDDPKHLFRRGQLQERLNEPPF